MRIRFGDHDLDEERLLLLRAGQRISIRPMVFDLLVHLARHRERVVHREELIELLWGDTAVGQGSLSGLVNELRKALGESGRGPSSIRTVHARGYQFVAGVASREVGSAHVGSAEVGRAEAPIETVSESTDDSVAHPGVSGHSRRSRDPMRGRLESLFERSRRGTALGLVLEVSSQHAGREALDGACLEAERQGFDAVRVPVARPGESIESLLVERVLDALIECRGIAQIRAVLPGRAVELLERSIVMGPLRPVWRRDALQARQYAERCWRSLACLLRGLSEARPLALVLDDLEPFDQEVTRSIASLLRLSDGGALVLITTTKLGTIDAVERERAMGGGRLEVVVLDPRFARGRVGLERALARRGMPPLPDALANALLEHFGGERGALEEFAGGLLDSLDGCGDEAVDGPATPGDGIAIDAPLLPSRALRRVRPDGIALDGARSTVRGGERPDRRGNQLEKRR